MGQSAPPDEAVFKPLLDVIFSMEMDRDELRKLEKTCRLSLNGDHLRAQQAYIDLTIGSAKWVIGGITYTNVNARDGRTSRTRDIKQNASMLDDDALKVSLQSFKRLLSYAETRESPK